MIVFLSPFPAADAPSDGYWARVKAIDGILSNHQRIYLNIDTSPEQGLFEFEENIIDGRQEVKINWYSGLGRSKMEALLVTSDIIYAHSIYQARFILPFFLTNKVILDLHGVVPEENLLYQDKTAFTELNTIEEFAYMHAKLNIFVTNSMAAHYASKYPHFKGGTLVLPIVPHHVSAPSSASRDQNLILYSGGNQPWQNLDKIFSFVLNADEKYKFLFLSPNWAELKAKASRLGILDRCTFGYASTHEELVSHYQRARFGLIIRDDNTVNRVSCPTKLFDYLAHGLIPIVDSPNIGDFAALGYRYFHINDFISSKIEDTIDTILVSNTEVLSKISDIFGEGSRQLSSFVSQQNVFRTVGPPVVATLGRFYTTIAPITKDGINFSEAIRSTTASFSQGQNIRIDQFSGKSQITGIAIIPTNSSCRVSGLSVVMVGASAPNGDANLSVSSMNGSRFGQYYHFKNTNPLITYDLPLNAQALEVKLSVTPLKATSPLTHRLKKIVVSLSKWLLPH